MDYKNIHPPGFARFLMKLFLSNSDYDQLAGDFQEIYHEMVEDKGKKSADWWYWLQLIKCIPNFAIFSIFWGGNMLKNYFKIAIRNIMKHKGYAFINIVGLAIGLASCILIMLFVIDEFSYDKFHIKSDQFYRLEIKGNFKGQDFHAPTTSHVYGPSFKNEIPGVENYIRLKKDDLSLIDSKNNTNEEQVMFADNSFFTEFSFNLLEGNKAEVLEKPYSVVISTETAMKYFGTKNVVGEQIRFEWNNEIQSLNVTGIMEKMPYNSHFRAEILISYQTLESLYDKQYMTTWTSNNIYTYIVLQDGKTVEDIQTEANKWFERNVGTEIKKLMGNEIDFNKIMQLHIRPIEEIHLTAKLGWEIAPQGDIQTVTIFLGISILVLIIACINFMNLSTARSAGRAKEVGLRKVVGATKKYLMNQFLAESIFLTMISLVIAILFVEAVLPSFNSFMMKHLVFDYINNPILIILLVGVALITGIGSGLYPAVFLSSFKPAKVLQGTQKSGTGGKNSVLRNVLVISQFVITITLLVGTFTLMEQMSYMKNKDLGFDKEQILVMYVTDNQLFDKIDVVVPELKKHQNVINASSSYAHPGASSYNDTGFKLKEAPKDEFEIVVNQGVDENFIPTMGIDIIAGRNFNKEVQTDVQTGVLINETLVKKFGFANPEEAINKPIQMMSQNGFDDLTIIGVMRDFNLKSLQHKIDPLALFYRSKGYYVCVKMKNTNVSETIEFIKTTTAGFSASSDFSYYFLDENFDSHYRVEERMQELFGYFSVLAILIACLGLFGLAAYITERRTKEIGIRKVMGAEVKQIIFMLSQQFVKWVLIANIIAWPIAYYLLTQWLENFPYRINLGVVPFLVSGIIAVIIALSTVTYQTYKAATANPIDSIVNE